jgi:thymidylate synthase
MLAGTFKTVPEAWEYAIREIYTRGITVDTEYGIKAKCINGMLLEITEPSPVWHKKDPWCSPERIKFYKEQFKRESAGKHGFEYTYIDRLVNYGGDVPGATEGFDQLAWMTQQLENKRYESKRIQAITWEPKVDCLKKEDQPCFQKIWAFPWKNNKLDVHIMYRSWDMFKAWEANLMAFQELIKDEFLMAGHTGSEFNMGALRLFGDNVHIYEDDWQAVEETFFK